jgi:hypothetical protein
MIIGPNGTGKSTLVCAICLGLGESPSLLNRAKDVGEYVKMGQREAEIEIELKALPSSSARNPVIQRVIKKEGNKSSYFINGKSKTRGEVQNLVRSFHIQIDNLCQFLPQDRVVEFAKMQPVEMLEATQRAVGNPQLEQWHEELKKLGKEAYEHSTTFQTQQERHKALKERQEQEQAEVDRMRDLNEMKVKLKALQKTIPGLKYQLAKEKYLRFGEDLRIAERDLGRLKDELEPAMQEIPAYERYSERSQQNVLGRKEVVTRLGTEIERMKSRLKEMKDSIKDKGEEIKMQQDTRKQCNKNIMQQSKQLSSLESRMNDPPEMEKIPTLNEKKRELERKRRDLNGERQDLAKQTPEILALARESTRRVREIQQELEGLETVAGQRADKLRALSDGAYKLVEWLKKPENKARFKDEVYGPPLVSCSLNDKRYLKEIETLMNYNDWLFFTVTNTEDHSTLSKVVYDELRLKRVPIRAQLQTLQQKRVGYGPDLLDRYGFDLWAIDAIQGPDVVLASLCDNNLHRTAMTSRSLSGSEMTALVNSPIQSYVTGGVVYSVRRRQEYGANAVSTNTVQVRDQAQYWTDASGPSASKALKEDQLKQAKQEEDMRIAELQPLQDRSKALKMKIEALEKTIVRSKHSSRQLLTLFRWR